MSMENPQHVYAILETENFGWWKVPVQALIQGIDEDAWTMVEEGWSKPTVMNDAGVTVVKLKRDWTVDEKTKSKYNSKALLLIWKSLSKAQFEQVQSCVTAIEAWDKLVTQYEGTDSVRRTWVDMLASKFETMTMEEHESIEAYSGRLNEIANEASVLGKKYKEEKLVKKFLRSLPDKFQSHKSAIDMSMNSDDMTFPQVIGMMQAYELEYNTKMHIKAKDVAFKSNTEERKSDELENQIGLIVKKHFKRLDQGQRIGVVSKQRSGSSHTRVDADRSLKQGDEQCYECQDFRHLVRNCPTIKRHGQLKCSVCKSLGHTRADCVGFSKGKEKSLLTWSDCDSEDEERDVSHSYEGYFGVIEDDETNLSMIEDNKLLSKHLIKTQDANMELTSENKQLTDSIKCLRAKYDKIDKETRSTNLHGIVDQLKLELKDREEKNQKLIANDLMLNKEIDHLKELLDCEKAESQVLRGRLYEQLQNIKMLSKGTKDLDKLLSAGLSGMVHWGLGYQGGPSTDKRVFVKASQPKMVRHKQQPQDGIVGRQLDVDQQKSQGVLTKSQPKMVLRKQQPQGGMVRRQLNVNQQKPQGVLTKQQPKMVQQRQQPRGGIVKQHPKGVQPRKQSQGHMKNQCFNLWRKSSVGWCTSLNTRVCQGVTTTVN
ncbi:hypothetical protein AALP_AA2G078000 [Arabis alpina]|uniref:CCHC-type domain-containing protein n=1 Tax=Arabis alpina TaxID=50452 RepID=A0A087HFZ0_ARAAL|nr:hypothetical protein AALP_AA2G078000 [Arabis alpina]